ncbi:MAG: hypothetical protein J0I97_08335, partial [Microbacterium sp.]|nr:hypothetical protein [Microbacterium sp.]
EHDSGRNFEDAAALVASFDVLAETRADLESFRADAMGSDLEWIKALGSLGVELPEGVAIIGFDLAPGAIPAAGTKPEDEAGLTGSLVLESMSPVEIVPVVRAFRNVPGVIAADGVQVTSDDGSSGGGAAAGSGGPVPYKYLIDVEFDQTLYTHAYAKDGQH